MGAEPSVVYTIVPSYNTADYLCRCLDSLLAQQGEQELCIYVVDNASSDDSVARVRREYPQVQVLQSDHNGGFAYAVNRGLRAVQADWAARHGGSPAGYYVLLLNSDTELPPTALAEMVAFMETRPEAGAAGPQLLMADGRMDLACRRSFPSPEVAFFRLVGLSRLFPRSPRFARYNLTYLDPEQTTEVDAVSGAFMLVRGAVAAEVGPLDESFFFYGEDLDWAFRIKALGHKVYYYPRVKVRHWKRASSRLRPRASVRDFYQAMRIFHRKHYAPRCPGPLNLLVEAGITLREGLALLPYLLRRTEGSR